MNDNIGFESKRYITNHANSRSLRLREVRYARTARESSRERESERLLPARLASLAGYDTLNYN